MIFGDWVRTVWHNAGNWIHALNPFDTTVRHPHPRAIIGEGPASRTRSVVDLSKEPAPADVEIADQPHHKQDSSGWFSSTFHTSTSSSHKTNAKAAHNDDSESSAWPKLLNPSNLFHHAMSGETPATSRKGETAKKNESPVAISGRRPVSAAKGNERSPRGGSRARPASRSASRRGTSPAKGSAKRARSVSKSRARPRTASPTKEPVEKKAKKASVSKKSTEEGQKRKADASGGSGRKLRSRGSEKNTPTEGGQKRKAGGQTGSGKQSRAK